MAKNSFLDSPLETVTDSIRAQKFELPPLPEIKTAAPAPATAPVADGRQPARAERFLPPDDFRPIFEAAAREFDVPVNVLMALGHQESRYNPNAIGKPTQWGRAKGMMQYIDDTAAAMGINPFNPAEAIPAAAKQLAERLKNGYSMEDAVKEHFAGPDRKLWGEKTAAYGREVMEKVGRIGELMGASGTAAAPEAEEPGRYVPLTAEQVAQVEAGGDPFKLPEPAKAPAEERGFFARAGDALETGYDNMSQSLATARFAVAGGDSSELAKALSDKFAREQAREKTAGEKEIDAGFKAVTDAKGVWDTTKAGVKAVGTAFANPKDLAVGIIEQTPNMLPTLAAGAGGAGTGAAVGAGVGAVAGGAGAAPGAVAGAIWGGRAGMVAGTTATELGAEVEQMILERMEEKKTAPTEQNIKALLDDKDFQIAARERGLKKGLTVGIIDQIFMGLGGKVLGKAATATTVPRKVALGAGAVGIDAVGETTGEATSQLVARGNVDAGDALREGVYGLGQSVVEPAIGAGMQAAKRAAGAATPATPPAAVTPAPAEPTATITPPEPSQATGPLSRAVENAATEPARVTVTAPEGEISGFVQSHTEDAQGNSITRVLGDDGQVYTFSSADGVQITPEAGPLTKAVEKAAEQPAPAATPEQNQEVAQDIRGSQTANAEQPAIDQPVPPAGTETAVTGADQQGAQPTQEAPTIAEPKPEPRLEDMSEPELRARLKYIASQGKTNGWNKLLTTERKKVEKAINALTEQQAKAPEPVKAEEPKPEPKKAPEFKGEPSELDAYLENKDGKWKLAKPVDAALRDAVIERMDSLNSAKEDTNGRDATDLPVRDVSEPGATPAAEQQADQPGAGAGSQADDAGGPASAAAPDAGAATAVSGADQTADANAALKDEHAGKWFGSREKADAYLAKRKITGTHEVTQTGKVRFEVKPKASVEQNAKSETQAPLSVTDETQAPAAVNTPVVERDKPKQPDKYKEIDRGFAENREAMKGLKVGDTVSYVARGTYTQKDGTKLVDPVRTGKITKLQDKEQGIFQIDGNISHGARWLTKIDGEPTGKAPADETATESQATAPEAKKATPTKRRTKQQPRRVYNPDGSYYTAPVEEQAEQEPQAATGEPAATAGSATPAPEVSANKVFTEDAAAKARALLKSKLGQLNSGIDPEMMQAGITLAGYHVEKGARTFAAYAKAMLEDLGDAVKPYLKSWYMAVAFDPRATGFDGMTPVGEVQAADIDALTAEIQEVDVSVAVREAAKQAGGKVAADLFQWEKKASTTAQVKIAVMDYLYENLPESEATKDLTALADEIVAEIAETPASPILEVKEAENANETEAAGGTGDRALEGEPAQEVRGAEGSGNAEQRSDAGGGTDAGGTVQADRAGDTGRGSVGDGARDVPVPARGRRGKRGSAGERGLQAELGIEPTGQRDVEVAAARREPEAAGDYRITDLTRLGEGGQKTKYRNNVAAIKLLNDLQASGRKATAEEQDTLARYVGWGGIPQAFDEANTEWAKEYAELKELLTPEEWSAAVESTQYAHYTSQEIIGGMYGALKRFGVAGGRFMEPGAGVGNFIGLMPEDLRSGSRFTAVERERIAGGIAKLLYPGQNVQQQDFRNFNAQDGYFDVVIGNPPFASTNLTDLSGRKHLSGLSIHNYFFAKSVDMLREGGVLAMVVSNSFLDAKGDKARRYIGERTELLGAIRLPNKAFAKNANTEVTTDIIFLKKRPEAEWGSKAAKDDLKRWQALGTVPDPMGGEPIPLNQYFIDHPEMMLGRMERAGSMYRADQPALIASQGADVGTLMQDAINRLPEGVYVSAVVQNTASMEAAKVVALDNAARVDVGGHYVKDGSVFVRLPDVAGEGRAMQVTATTKISEKRDLGANGLERIKHLAEMRVTVRKLLAAEMKDGSNIEELRATLNEQYDTYVKEHGYINQRGTVQVFGDDPDFPLLASLEHGFDPGIGAAAAKSQGIKPVAASARKAPIFSRRVIERHEEITTASTPEDALMISIAERGQIDTGYIGSLLNRDGAAVLEELTKGDKPALFIDPATNGYVLRDAYLSGNVRKKVKQAKAAGMYRNVAELEKVVPEDIPAHEISGKIGAPWVPPAVYEQFAQEIMGEGTRARIVYVPAMSSYVASFEAGSDVANTNTFGTKRMGADEIYAALLNSKEIKVGHYEEDANGSRRFVLEKEPTDEANDKAREIKDKFNDWLFADGERAEKMQRAYNDAVNNYVTRVFDGSMLKLPGKVPDVIIKLRRHQRNAVARIIQDGRALLDHVVGAGKTYTIIAAAMEMKRTGLAMKPMIVVPNHLVKQWAADFYRLYPGANILTATKKDFEKANRRKFLAKIATGNWDAVIMAHSSFGFIKPDQDFELRFNQERIDEIVEAMQALKDEKDQQSKRTVKQLAKMKENLENKLASLRDKPMDDLLDLGQIGVDNVFVDEAHLFKNLMFVTKMQNVRGLGQPKGSQRAYDMFIKTHQVYEKNGNGRGVVFATGTPVSNSLAEMYHMLRYLAPETLKDSGQFTFDAWAKTFADVEQVWMQSLSGDGYKSSNRMSRFVNTPELLRVYDQVADTVTIDDIKTAFAEENGGKEFPIPKQKGGRRTPVSIPRTPEQTEYMGEIAKRAKALEQRKGKPQKGDDNMLSIMGDARKSAMDIRMVRPDIKERDPNGRIAIAARNIFDRYQKYNDVRGTQLVFSDMGTPKKHAEKELKEYNELMAQVAPLSDDKVLAMAELGDEAAQEQIEDAEEAQRKIDAKGQDWLDAIKAAMRGFSIYDDMRDALIELGIPEREIAFIHDFNTDDQKAALFRAVNDGKVRVILGSTEKMGAGTNVQERAVALHHLDVPWKPSDIEQREGRVIRQGNKLLDEIKDFEVEVLAYATQDTLDLFMWQTQEKKLSMIGQLRTGNVGREFDNAFEEMQMSAGEMQAAATSNPYLLEEIQLKDKVKKLERQKRSFDGQKNDLENRKRKAEKEIGGLPAQIKQAKTIETAATTALGEIAAHFAGLTAVVNGQKITGAKNIREALREAVHTSPMVGKDGKEVRQIAIAFNGKDYTSESGIADAANKALGDAAEIAYTLPTGETVYRGADVVAGLIDPIANMMEASTSNTELGKVGAFEVTAYRIADGKFDVIVSLNGADVGDYEVRFDPKEPGGLNAQLRAIPANVGKIIQSGIGLPDFLQSKLERAKRTLADVESKPSAGAWEGEAELKKAREDYKVVLKKLAEKEADKSEATPEAEEPRYSVAPDGAAVAEFGPVTEAYRNDPAGAVRYLMEQKTGEAIVDHPTLGEISLVYGDGTMGLSHIATRRGDNFLKQLPDLIGSGQLYAKPDQEGRVFIGTAADEAAIRLDWNGRAKARLVSAYEKHPDLSAAADPRASMRSETVKARTGLDIAGLNRAVTSGVIGQAIQDMIDRGGIVLHQNASTLPGKGVRGVQAVTLENGDIHLVASALTAENARAVLLHEMFHRGAEPLVGSREWGNLMGRMGSLYRQSEQSSGIAREFFDRARARVAAAKRQGAVSTKMEVEEFAAYAIEEWERAPDSLPAAIRKWIEDYIGTVKAYVLARFGLQAGDVTPAQLAGLAKIVIADAQMVRLIGPIATAGFKFSVADPISTPAFKRWFGDSKVVDSDGKPLAVYHGTTTDKDFAKFKTPAYFTSDADAAQVFGEDAAMQDIDDDVVVGSRLMPVYLSIKNPMVMRDFGDFAEWSARDRTAAEKRGYDGLRITMPDNGETLWMAFRPEQIKSAIGNRGTFDPANPDIRYSVAPEQALAEAEAALDEPKAKDDYIGRVVGDISLGARLIVHPRTVAATHPEFTPVYRTAISQMETRDKNIADFGADVKAYDHLDQAGKESVNKVLELGRLMSVVYTADELTNGVVNTGEKKVVALVDGKPKMTTVPVTALLTGAGEVIQLSEQEIAAYRNLRNMFDHALDRMRAQTLTEMGFGGFAPMEGMKPLMIEDTEDGKIVLKGSVYTDEEKAQLREAAGNKAEIAKGLKNNPVAVVMRKFDGARWNPEKLGYEFDARQRPALEKELGAYLQKSAAAQILELIDKQTPPDQAERLKNIATFVAEIEQAKRAGYVPFARYGDYVVTVKEKIADANFVEDDKEHYIAQGLPDSFAADMLELGAEKHEEGWRIKKSQKGAVEKLTEKTVYSAKVETGLTDRLDEARAGKVDDIKAVRDAIEAARKEWVGDNPARRVVAFKVREKTSDQQVKLSDVDALAEVASIDNATWDAIRDKLADAIKSKGFRRHFFHSDNVPGYTGDFERTIADYVIGMSGYLSRRQHAKRWENSVTAIKDKPKLYTYAAKYRDYVNNPQEELAMVRQIGFFSYIAGVMASAFANLTQVPLLTVPTLSQLAPVPLVMKELTVAYKDAAKMLSSSSGLDMFDPDKAPADVRAILKEAWAEGSFVPLESFDLMMTARQRNVGARKGVKAFNTTTQVVALAFTFAERMNRLVTFIAAARLAAKPAVQANARNILKGDALARAEVLRDWNPKSFAEWAVDESQYRMGKANRPTMMRGLGSAIMQFKGFMLQTFEAWYRMAALHGKPGKYAAAASILGLYAFAGVWGLPGADDLRKLIENIYKQITDKDLDLKTELRAWIARTSGSNALAMMVNKGVPYPLGVDLTRVGMGAVAPNSPLAAAGIPFDMLIGRPKRAFEKASAGDELGAAAELTPNFIKHWLVAGSWALDGVRDKSGNRILKPDELSAGDLAMKTLGFQPSVVTDIRDYEYAERRMETAVDALKRSYTNKIARAIVELENEKDPAKAKKIDERIGEIYADINEHNATATPEQIIRINNRTLRGKIMRESDGVKGSWGRERKAARETARDLRGVFGLSQEDDE